MNTAKKANILALTIICLFTLGSIGLSFALQFIGYELSATDSILIPQILFISLPIIIYFSITKADLAQTIRIKKISVKTSLLTILMTFFIIPVVSLLNYISMFFVKNHIGDTISSMTGISLLLSLLLAALLPAINEEFLTRGIFLSAYRKHGILKAILLSSLLFGMIHMNINQFLYAFFIGCVFSLLVEATGSIFPAIIAHFTINGNSIFILWLFQQLLAFIKDNPELSALYDFETQLDTSATQAADLSTLGGLVIVAAISGFIAFFIFKKIAASNDRLGHIQNIFSKNAKPAYNEDGALIQEDVKSKLITWPIYVCILIFIALSIYIEML